MINFDEDALICDLAETYHILDYRSLPLNLVATLSAGLRADSRIMLHFADAPVSQELILLASIADRIEMFRHSFGKSKEPPISLVQVLYGNAKRNNNGIVGFDSSDEFESTIAKLRGE